MDTATLAALGTIVTGTAGVLFAIYKLRGQSDDDLVQRQHEIIGDMKTLTDELRTELADCRHERDRLRGH